ncbi:MAG: alpha-amylase [Truepera sp.]|nr:alpha-amylase [Truepera sp.]
MPEYTLLTDPLNPNQALEREFHMNRAARQRYQVKSALFGTHGNVIFADYSAAQELAHSINTARLPETAVSAGDLAALGLLDELYHLLIDAYREEVNPEVLAKAYRHIEQALGEQAQKTLHQFAAQFPAAAVYRGEQVLDNYLAGQTAGVPHRQIVLEELLMLWLDNENPACERYRELFDDSSLREVTAYSQIITELKRFFDQEPGFGPDGASLFALLRAPALHSPTSLAGQLEYIRAYWTPILGARFERFTVRLLLSLDIFKEEAKWGLVGGEPETVVLDEAALRGPARRGPVEYERFSPDQSWMPRLVMIAKSTYVWLDQLSKQYQRPLHRLDQIPDQELDRLAEFGFSGLWLIGLWERSPASARIKHLMGNPDAVASAYSLYDYTIAHDLGGESAYQNLRDRAWQRGIRLASDMVPNHMGIDSRWVIEHPDWFLSLSHPPYPGYTYSGPDLSSDPRVGIFIEDHYYHQSDAAVVFKRVDRWTDEARYIYHGNDGTSMPWNDTAQLNYLQAEVREAVIQTILAVARRFPIIRFDAAMTLAKQHVQRLWFPEPGQGGAIPSRAQYGSMSHETFEALMPNEFWREVVDRVATEVPDTLLLAEAFWMLEGYFVRTLGMHRVYNSAFMNMLKREENQKYRQTIKNIIEFEPEIIKRFVNFMNNPDEETAVAQFGQDGKYFGVCVMMVTLPGLPMFGHGQLEGYHEKYGMEYRRAKWDEEPNQWLIERHRREIVPLLKRRSQFAEVENFLLYDFYQDGYVNENVFAYTNRHQGQASLVVYNNKYEAAQGWLRQSLPYKAELSGDPADTRRTGRSQTKLLAEGLGLSWGQERFCTMREHPSGLEYLRRNRELFEQGLYLELGAFGYQVYWEVREVVDVNGLYAQLHRELGGRGVPSIEMALSDLKLRPLHEAWAGLFAVSLLQGLAEGDTGVLAPLEEALAWFWHQAAAYGFMGDAEVLTEKWERIANMLERLAGEEWSGDPADTRRTTLQPYLTLEPSGCAVLLAGELLSQLEDVTPGLVERGRLVQALCRALERLGMSAEEAARRAELPTAVRRHELKPLLEDPSAEAVAAFWQRFLDDPIAAKLLLVNEHQGVRWFNREAYRELVAALVQTAALAGAESGGLRTLAQRFREVEGRSSYQLNKLISGQTSYGDPASIRRTQDQRAEDTLQSSRDKPPVSDEVEEKVEREE